MKWPLLCCAPPRSLKGSWVPTPATIYVGFANNPVRGLSGKGDSRGLSSLRLPFVPLLADRKAPARIVIPTRSRLGLNDRSMLQSGCAPALSAWSMSILEKPLTRSLAPNPSACGRIDVEDNHRSGSQTERSDKDYRSPHSRQAGAE